MTIMSSPSSDAAPAPASPASQDDSNKDNTKDDASSNQGTSSTFTSASSMITGQRLVAMTKFVYGTINCWF
jgi:hypothetical protein